MRVICELTRYGVKGGVATLLNVGFMALLVERWGLRPAGAAVVSTSLLLLAGYVAMNRFVFPSQQTPEGARGHLRRGISYYTIILSGKAVNYALFLAFVAVGVWYPLAWILGAGMVFLGTFSANRWLWRSDPHPS